MVSGHLRVTFGIDWDIVRADSGDTLLYFKNLRLLISRRDKEYVNDCFYISKLHQIVLADLDAYEIFIFRLQYI